MNAANLFSSILSERNKSGQGVQRDLIQTDIPTEILGLLEKARQN